MTQTMADVLAANYLGFEGAEAEVAQLTAEAVTETEAALVAQGLLELEDGELYAATDAWDRLQAAQDAGQVAR